MSSIINIMCSENLNVDELDIPSFLEEECIFDDLNHNCREFVKNNRKALIWNNSENNITLELQKLENYKSTSYQSAIKDSEKESFEDSEVVFKIIKMFLDNNLSSMPSSNLAEEVINNSNYKT